MESGITVAPKLPELVRLMDRVRFQKERLDDTTLFIKDRLRGIVKYDAPADFPPIKKQENKGGELSFVQKMDDEFDAIDEYMDRLVDISNHLRELL